ncbi:MAG TPA: anthranilate synthase component I family protein, partial [Nitrospiria bacterium]|nr:anthranilate synthase component I family protein [Nitrospiria bacterium]
IYQANLSQKFLIKDLRVPPIELYRKLRDLNPSPFSAFLDTGEHQLISASPERLFSLRKGQLTTRPIAGTRPRGNTPEEERHYINELLASEKEQAEHLMLIDLERNDIGRVCDFGTIKVEEMMTVETYSHVHHLVSSISGRIRKDTTWLDTLSALFPGGTITGTPKIRSMEIIDALEPTQRGPYTGSIGYISHSGEMDWNIIIRTLFHSKGEGVIQTGAGIVADSLPAREYDETLRKAEALFRVIATGSSEK